MQDKQMSLVSNYRQGYDLRFSMMADRIAALPMDLMEMIIHQVKRIRAAISIQAVARGMRPRQRMSMYRYIMLERDLRRLPALDID